MTARTKPLLEPKDLLRMPNGESYELVDGVPVEKDMGAESDEIMLAIGSTLRAFALAHGLGRAYTNTGFQCFPGRPRLVRRPDAAFVAKGRLPDDRSPKGFITVAPDLAVEVVSPNDRAERVEIKVAEYRSAGVRLIWVVYPETKTVLVRRLDGTCSEANERGELSGEEVLPGFTCKVADLFA